MFTKKVVTATGLYQAIGKGCNENKSSMSLNKMRQNLTKTTAVAAVIGVATCLFPAIAQAQLATDQAQAQQAQPVISLDSTSTLIAEDEPNLEANVRQISFVLNTSVQDTEPADLNVGKFPEAIQNFRIDSNDDNLDLFRESGTLTTSRLTIDPSTSEVLPRIPDFDGDNIRFDRDIVPDGTFNNDWLRFDATFPNTPTTLTLFIPSTDPSLINSLSGLDEILLSGRVQAVVSRPGVDRPRNVARFLASNPDRNRQALNFRVATVPEPTATASLLGLGTLGAISLLKRNKRLKKSV
ncbi:PEP-CTERM sorting domain-containing protein [Scytonema sp. HK-05]|uniref:PEP-CTERM sorting domain-containing protein n=1 Tax=Scytonema sp. HK-05 TaxID=1137095 RepID=UPI000936D542|nr:PEP-CTERM sorting domain-containing protein [Scytonema sp. HK-05]